MTLEQAKDLAAIVGAVIALVTLVKGVVEYVHQGAQKRAEQFSAMRLRFKNDEQFKQICDLLETDSPGLVGIPFKDKRDFLGFFEEVALMLNSGILRAPVAHYMFGYYALRCADSDNFWSDVNRDSPYWSLFNDFVAQMRRIERNFAFKQRTMRF